MLKNIFYIKRLGRKRINTAKSRKIYQFLKAKIKISSRKFSNPDERIKIIVAYQCSWIVNVQKSQAKLSKIETPDYDLTSFDCALEFEPQAIIDMFGKELLSVEYVKKCIVEKNIVLLKGANYDIISQIFFEFPYVDAYLEIEKNCSFDLDNSICTTGDERDMYIGTAAQEDNTGYMGTPIKIAKDAFGRLNIQFQDFRFVELGCGKGRIVILAAFYPFKKIVGVEYSSTLQI